ncbi:hypothetical protein [Paenibacillus sp. 1001270B_150601_E10]|uniref:hypothetical protein n=1 Tax=Paenibacillus sp. 1001270B_150601_E10 TaxID=2787079 RepID=UPI00189C9B8C|nr:hypothetical protein [Paenibacillus sp. 1001270B_150601_E10]
MKIVELEKIVKEQDKRIKELEAKACIDEPPEWAKEACVNAKRAGIIDTSNNGSRDFYRFKTVLDRLGYLIKTCRPNVFANEVQKIS